MGNPNEQAPEQTPLSSPVADLFLGLKDEVAAAAAKSATDKASSAWSNVQQDNKGLSDHGAGTDPPYSSSLDPFESMTHQQLYDAVKGKTGLDPAGLLTLAQTWLDSGSKLDNTASFTLALGMNQIFGHGLWEGTSGSAAKEASDAFCAATNQIGQVFMDLAERMNTLQYSAEAVRAAVPPPAGPVVLNPNPDDQVASLLPGLANPQATDKAAAAQEQARQEAIRALRTIYSPSFPPSGTGVPSYTTVPGVNPSTPVNTPQPDSHTAPVAATPSQQPAPGTHSPTAPEANQPGDNSPSSPNGPTTQPAAAATHPGTTQAGQTPATTLAGVGPTTPGAAPGTAAPIGLGPNMGTDAGSAGGSGLGGLGVSRPGVPGLSVPGTAAAERAASAEARAAASAAASAAGAGSSRMGGLPHGQGRAKKDEEEAEHYSPDYLKRVQSEWTDNLESPVDVVGAGPEFDDDRYRTMPAETDESMPAPPDAVPKAAPLSHNEIAAKLAESGISVEVNTAGADTATAGSGPRPNGRPTSGETDQVPGDESAQALSGPDASAPVSLLTLTGTGPVMDDEDDASEGTGK